jgi:hypothetical protein
MTVTNQIYIYEMMSRLNSGNACYHSVQNLLSYWPLSKNIRIKVRETRIVPVLLYGSETSFLVVGKKWRVSRVWGSHGGEYEVAVFWVVAPCSLVEVYQRFRGPCCLHHQGDELIATTQKTAILVETEFVWEQGDENVWSKERGSKRKEEIA